MRERIRYYFQEKAKIKVILKNGYNYSGFVVLYTDFEPDTFELKDKYGNKVLINISDISAIIKIGEGKNGRE